MEYIAFAAAILMGILLGLVGAGGSILTLPVLVYLLHIPTTEATTYSLFVVGISAFIAATDYVRNKLVCFKTVFFFGLPSLTATYLSRTYLVSALPEIIRVEGFSMSKNVFVLILFSILMLGAALSMIFPPKVIRQAEYDEARRYRYLLIFAGGAMVGILVGFLGAGGGFLIIPTLVILANLPMKKAVGTSLALILINCTIGFSSDLLHGKLPEWNILLPFTGFAVAGIIGGLYLSRIVPGTKLRPAFGWFVLSMGTFIIIKELLIS